MLREYDFDIVKRFKVNNFTIYSDHTPLSIALICGKQLPGQDAAETDYEYYQWNDQKKDLFRRGLITKLPDLNKLVFSDANLNSANICNTVNEFVQILDSATKPLFCKSRKPISENVDLCQMGGNI